MTDDLISKRAAIEIIQSMYPGMPRVPWMLKNWKKQYEPYIMLEEEIKGLPSAQPEPRWIPVTERLPEEGVHVLVTRTFLGCRVYYGGDVIPLHPNTYVEIAYFNGDRWIADSEDAKIGKHTVVAWMPLPKPWKGESDAEVH